MQRPVGQPCNRCAQGQTREQVKDDNQLSHSDISQAFIIAESGATYGEGLPRPRVLVVEDNSDMREFLARVLSMQGYDFLEAADGEEGLHMARTQSPSLILMDISLPALDGFEATRLLKQDPAMRHIPIIAVTAHARPADEQRALDAGCDGYLSKPYSLRDFLTMVEQALGRPRNL